LRRQGQYSRPKTLTGGHGPTLGGKKPITQVVWQIGMPEKKGRSFRRQPFANRHAIRQSEVTKHPAKTIPPLPDRNEAQGLASRQPGQKGRSLFGVVLRGLAVMRCLRGVDAGQTQPAAVFQKAGIPIKNTRHGNEIRCAFAKRRPEKHPAKAPERHADRGTPSS
jgi:hypothetical protein